MIQPAVLLPDAMSALQALGASIQSSGLPPRIAELSHLRASQINGCATCVYGAVLKLQKDGESDERLATLVTWRDAPFFSEAERAALALTEAATRLDADGEPVSDEIWQEAQRHFDEPQLAGLILCIANSNVWNRLNVVTKQVAGAWKP